jgi:hypothetical protein
MPTELTLVDTPDLPLDFIHHSTHQASRNGAPRARAIGRDIKQPIIDDVGVHLTRVAIVF